MPPAVHGRRRIVVPLVVIAAIAVGVGAFLVGHGSASAGAPRSAATDSSVVRAVEPATSTTSTVSTIPRQVAGERLAAGPNTVYVLGDSVMLGARAQVPAAMPGWDVTFDAKESRRIDQGIDIVAAHAAPIARVLVVHLCTNWFGGDYRAEATKLLAAAQGVERVVWMTCVPWRPEVEAADVAIRALPDEFPTVVVADWQVLAGEPGYTANDRLHLDLPGALAMASLVAGTVGPAPAPA